MIKCQKCGNELPENSMCCNFCGAKIEFSPLPVTQQKTVNKKQNSKPIIITIAVAALVIAVVISIVFIPKMISKNDNNSEQVTTEEYKIVLNNVSEVFNDDTNVEITNYDSTDNNSENTNTEEKNTVNTESVPSNKIPAQENKRLLDKAFSSGNFYIEMTSKLYMTPEASLDDTYKFGTCGNNIYMRHIYVGTDVFFIIKDKKMYCLDERNKRYGVRDLSIENDYKKHIDLYGIRLNGKYVQTSEVTENGKTYICEEYISDAGTSKYYFDKNSEIIAKIEHEDLSPNVYIVNKFVKNPGESYFAIPSDYQEVDVEFIS